MIRSCHSSLGETEQVDERLRWKGGRLPSAVQRWLWPGSWEYRDDAPLGPGGVPTPSSLGAPLNASQGPAAVQGCGGVGSGEQFRPEGEGPRVYARGAERCDSTSSSVPPLPSGSKRGKAQDRASPGVALLSARRGCHRRGLRRRQRVPPCLWQPAPPAPCTVPMGPGVLALPWALHPGLSPAALPLSGTSCPRGPTSGPCVPLFYGLFSFRPVSPFPLQKSCW